MQESKSRSSEVTDNAEDDTAEQSREDGDGCKDGRSEGEGGAGSDGGNGATRTRQLSSDEPGPIVEEQVP